MKGIYKLYKYINRHLYKAFINSIYIRHTYKLYKYLYKAARK